MTDEITVQRWINLKPEGWLATLFWPSHEGREQDFAFLGPFEEEHEAVKVANDRIRKGPRLRKMTTAR